MFHFLSKLGAAIAEPLVRHNLERKPYVTHTSGGISL